MTKERLEFFNTYETTDTTTLLVGDIDLDGYMSGQFTAYISGQNISSSGNYYHGVISCYSNREIVSTGNPYDVFWGGTGNEVRLWWVVNNGVLNLEITGPNSTWGWTVRIEGPYQNYTENYFNPLDIGNLELWFDAEKDVTEVGGNVSAWEN